ncbi:heme ABC exporter, ATP-binding protein CcmA [Wolbachia pipientis]|uniref:Heme ABC exporter, ATP-binding protein CcmA n=1 Tax=Wolbachia pipientis TaxID=955 RepID=A0A1E7QIQ9_WOLPI|nr:heme ABC exporter ATP-binding protein CcmA [Wolbachia pipientis]OEY86362.1 heme ABC exporter, ATP-binding protein CcmA [Wolbachia pipientis]
MLECKNLSCTRNDKTLFTDFSFTAKPKSKISIIGPNGSGKTSLMRILSGLLPPTSGNITYCDNDIYDNLQPYKSSMVYIGHKNAFNNNLTVIENIKFWAEIRNTHELILATIHCLQLQPILNIKYAALSAGWKRRAALSRLLVSNATIWLIDEPFCNLDITAYHLVLNIISIRAEQNGITIITGHSTIEGFSSINL